MMQKTIAFRRWADIVVSLIVVLLGMGSCKKSSPPVTNPVTPLNALINTDTSLSLFHHMLLVANDAGLLADNSITFLIPTNTAFRAAGYSVNVIDSLTPSVADRIISFHFIPSHVVPDSNGYTPYPTHRGYSVFGEKDGNSQIWFNGGMAGDTSMVGKALVFRLKSVLLSPADSLSLSLSGDSTLSFAAELFRRTGLDTTLTPGNFTVLAPNNAAFRKAGYDSIPQIDSADLSTMMTLAKYHVLPGQYFTNTLAGLNSIVTLQGGSLTLDILNGVQQFSGAGNVTPANLLKGNQPAGNTLVIHKIDALLQP